VPSPPRSRSPRAWRILPLLLGLLAGSLLASPTPAQNDEGRPYEATYESLEQHEAPEWFHDAKLGIFIHWGVCAVAVNDRWGKSRGKRGDFYTQEMLCC